MHAIDKVAPELEWLFSGKACTGKKREDTIEYEVLDLSTVATAQGARSLRVRFQEWLQAAGTPVAVAEDLALAVYEAAANVVEHAYPTDHPDPAMRLRAQFEQDQVLITISDHGCWRSSNAPGRRGRGLSLIRHFVTEAQIHPTPEGTTVRLRAPRHPR